MITYFRKHPWSLGALAVIVAGLAWLAFGFFGVQTLFFDKEVSEALPTFDQVPAAQVAATEPSLVTNQPEPAAVDAAAPAPDTTTVDPADPADSDATVAPADQSTTQEIATEYSGGFEAGAHPTNGTALVLGNGTDQRYLRFEDFETDNGPDLNVYLVNSSTGDVSDFFDLGDLKGNIGEQNYEIPAGADLDVYDRVVIWCVRFNVGFGDAMLEAV